MRLVSLVALFALVAAPLAAQNGGFVKDKACREVDDDVVCSVEIGTTSVVLSNLTTDFAVLRRAFVKDSDSVAGWSGTPQTGELICNTCFVEMMSACAADGDTVVSVERSRAAIAMLSCILESHAQQLLTQEGAPFVPPEIVIGGGDP